MDEAELRVAALMAAQARRHSAMPSPPPMTVPAHGYGTPFHAGDDGPLPEVPAGLADALAPLVAAAMPGLAARIADGAAADLGRDPGLARDPVRAERILGALEVELAARPVAPPPVLVARVSVPRVTGDVAVVRVAGGGEIAAAMADLAQFAPGLQDVVAGLVGVLADHPAVAPLLAVTGSDEAALAAGHGRGHLALAAAVAAAVVRAADAPIVGVTGPGVVGLALDAVRRVLPTRPLPPAYAAARVERRRREYLMPRGSIAAAPVADHRFVFAEADPGPLGEPPNGLAQAVPGGIAVRTGGPDEVQQVSVHVLEEPPPESADREWDEIVELSWDAPAGSAGFVGARATDGELAPPWPGPLRARVHARGRDGDRPGHESFLIALWSAPLAPERVLRATDRLGHRLRGEPVPPEHDGPELAYRWVNDTALGFAATLTVAVGPDRDAVLAAFGVEPAARLPAELLRNQYGVVAWATVHERDGAVLVLEPNGWQAKNGTVLSALTARGRAAVSYRGGHGVTTQLFARDGRVLAEFEWLGDDVDPEIRALHDGLDMDDFTDGQAKHLVAMERFTGVAVTREDFRALEEAEVGYLLPER